MVRNLAVCGGFLAIVSFAAAGTPDVDVIYSRVLTSPTATVPGAVDANGIPTSTQWSVMSEFWLSPDGTVWMLRGTTTQATDGSAVVVLGGGVSGSMLLQEGRPFPGAVGDEVVDFFNSMNNPINDDNDLLVSVRARGGVDAVSSKLVVYDELDTGVAYQRGDLYTGVMDRPEDPSGDELLGNSLQSGVLLNDGRVGWRDDTVANLHSTRRPVVAFNAVKYLQESDIVASIDGETAATINNIGSTGSITILAASPDGSVIVLRGNVTDENGTSDVVIVNEEVILQVGYQIEGSTVTPTDFHATFVAPNSDWYARGTQSASPWATRNGVVIAQGGDAVGGDAWITTQTFFSIAGNSNGDWAIAGKTNNPDPAIDDAIVVNGEVVLREGDPVVFDIDGDGMADDTAYIGRGNNTLSIITANSLYLAPDKTVYVLANLRDEFGSDLGPTALIRINPTGDQCAADFDGNGTVEVPDIFAFLSAWFAGDESADLDGTPGIAVPDIFAFLSLWFAGC
jgi:hypothetical protein